MAQTPTRGRTARLALAGLLLLCLCGVGAIVALELSGPAPEPPPVVAQAAPEAPPPPPVVAPAPPALPPHAAPSFDVVRVSPQGDAVIAGRAEPGDQVTVHDGAHVLGQVAAGPGGDWVLTVPLEPGGRELTLSSRDPTHASTPEVLGSAPVLLVVPDHGAGGPAQTSLAVLAPNGAAPRVLQGAGSSSLGLDTVDYDDAGRIRFAGHAPPDASVRLYVDNAPAGDVRADAQGRWVLTPTRPISAGTHRLRVDQLGQGGRVASRVELPFRRATLPAGAVQAGRLVVQPGENLWRLARTVYGAGTQYTVIYRANRDQIRDPAVIYPGQTFDIPKSGGT